MKNRVAVEFSISGASGRISRFHSASDAFHPQLLLARSTPHLQQGGGGAVPLLVQVQACPALLERVALVEQMSGAPAHGSCSRMQSSNACSGRRQTQTHKRAQTHKRITRTPTPKHVHAVSWQQAVQALLLYSYKYLYECVGAQGGWGAIVRSGRMFVPRRSAA